MNWREVFATTEEYDSNAIPLSLGYLQRGNVVEGDYVTTDVNIYDPRTEENSSPVFFPDKLYKVERVYPQNGPEAQGIIVDSEKGKWYLDFGDVGGAEYFKHVKLSPDERLGLLESIPYEIMQLLDEHGSSPRSRIITALLQQHYVSDRAEMKRLRDDVTEALSLLLSSGKIKRSARLGYYEITPEAQREMHVPPGGYSHE